MNKIKSPIEASILKSIETHFVLKGEMTFTKSKNGYGYGEVTFDHDLYFEMLTSLFNKVPLEVIKCRYERENIQSKNVDFPRHYPVKIQNPEGVFANNENLFIYFPHCFQNSFTEEQDAFFSLEFYQRTELIFLNILTPIFKKIFGESENLTASISMELPKNIMTFTTLHELGHQVGNWYMSPNLNKEIKVGGFKKGIFGELSSDLFSAVLVPESVNANLLNLMMKCFYYARIGFNESSRSGRLNNDNDAWEGILLLKEFLDADAISKKADFYELNLARIALVCKELLQEVNNLGATILKLENKERQDRMVESWMASKLPKDADSNWIYPEAIKELFQSIAEIPETII